MALLIKRKILCVLAIVFFIFQGVGCDIGAYEHVSSVPTPTLTTIPTAYYVAKTGNDSNAGTIDSPWLTIQHAASIMIASDTCYVRAGTYNEIVTPSHSGSSGNPITYQSYPGDTVVIDGTGLAPNLGLFNIINKNYVTLKGMTLQNSNGAGSAHFGVWIYGACDHVTVQNLFIQETGGSGVIAVSTNWGYPITVTNLTIDSVETYHTNSASDQESISLQCVSNFEIKNCKVHDMLGNNKVGIDTKVGCHDGSIHNNEIYTVSVGIYLDAADTNSYNLNVYNNKSHDNNNAGMAIAAELGANWTDVNVYNNLFYNNGFAGIALNSNMTSCTNTTITVNTFYGIQTYGIFYNESVTTFSNCAIHNNIFYGNVANSYAIYDNGHGSSGINIDHNLFYK